jgi:hypothetical protein
MQPKIKEAKRQYINNLEINRDLKEMCNVISVNLAAILGEELLHIKNKFSRQGIKLSQSLYHFIIIIIESIGKLDDHNYYPHVECEWEKVFRSRAIKAYNDNCLMGLREKLEQIAMEESLVVGEIAKFRDIFDIKSFHGVQQIDGGFVVEFEPELNYEPIKYFFDELSAALVREQILDELKMTTTDDNYYRATNFTEFEWECLKKMKRTIVEFGRVYTS